MSAVNDSAVSTFLILPTNGRSSTSYLSPLGKISTAISGDYASLISTSKDKPVVGCLGCCCCWSCVEVHYKFTLSNSLYLVSVVIELSKIV